jgi:hypothetical protein
MVRSKGGGSHLRARASEPSSLGLVLVTCARSGSPDPASGGTTGGRTFSGVAAPGKAELIGDEVGVGAGVGGLGGGATEVGPFEVGTAGAAAIGVGIAALVRKLVSILSKARGVTLPSTLPVPDPTSEAVPVPIPIVAPCSVPHWEQTFDSD